VVPAKPGLEGWILMNEEENTKQNYEEKQRDWLVFIDLTADI